MVPTLYLFVFLLGRGVGVDRSWLFEKARKLLTLKFLENATQAPSPRKQELAFRGGLLCGDKSNLFGISQTKKMCYETTEMSLVIFDVSL